MRRNHIRYLELASGFVDDSLSPREKKSFERHCKECEECTTFLRQLKSIHSLISEHGGTAIPPFFMTRLHARLKEQVTSIDPWLYEAKRLFPVFSILAAVLFLLLLFRSDKRVKSPDEYYLSSPTPTELRVLTQRKAYTTDEVFVLAMTQDRREK